MSVKLLLPIRGSHFLYSAAVMAVRVYRSASKSLLRRGKKERRGLEMGIPTGTHHLRCIRQSKTQKKSGAATDLESKAAQHLYRRIGL